MYAPPHSKPSAGDVSIPLQLMCHCEQPTLKLDLILNHKGVVLVVNGLGEFGRNGVVGSLVLDDQSLVTLHALQHGRLLNRPSANVSPLFVVGLDILLRVRGLPSGFPVIGELLQEGGFKFGGLHRHCQHRARLHHHTCHSQ